MWCQTASRPCALLPNDAEASQFSAALMELGATICTPRAPDCAAFEAAFARRRVPLTVVAIADARICDLYERRFVLVRPDGHVAWRSDTMPDDPLAVVDRVRGA